MNKPDDGWLEARVRTRVLAHCEELGWGCRFEPWECNIWVKEEHHTVLAEWRRLQAAPVVVFQHAVFGGFVDSRPCAPELLQFLLARNAELGGMHWCLSRYHGVAVRAVRPFDSLTIDVFRDTVLHLIREVRDVGDLIHEDGEKRATTTESGEP